MWELDYKESWAPKNWCIWTVVLEKTLESPLDCKRSNQSILKKISPECSLEGLMPKLKLQSFGHLMQRADSFEKTLMGERLKAGGEGDDRGWDGWMVSLTQWTWVWVNSRSWWGTGRPDVLQSMGSQLDMTERLNWTDWMYVYGGPQKSDALEFMRPFQSKHTHLGALSWEWFEFILSLLFYPSSSFFLVSNWAITFGVSETHGLFITFSLIIFRVYALPLLGFPCGSAGKESACSAGDLGSIPGLGRSPGEGKGYPLQYSGLENSLDCIIYGVTKSQTRLSKFHYTLLE